MKKIKNTLDYVLQLVRQERVRQQNYEGWTKEHDDKHTDGELAEAAATYAASCNLTAHLPEMVDGQEVLRKVTVLRGTRWPFEPENFKPTPNNRLKELTKAGALIIAEMERVLRATEDDGIKDFTLESRMDDPVDWLSVPEIEMMVETLGTLRDADGERTKNVGQSLMPKGGNKYWLEVRCKEPEILQAVFHSMFTMEDGSGSFVPGANIESIHFNDPAEKGAIEVLDRMLEDLRRKQERKEER